MEIIDIFVDKFYQMDPDFEDVLPNGFHLREGMMVLIEDSLIREDTYLPSDERSKSYQLDRLRENNRWCIVSDIEINQYRDKGTNYSIVTFIATYPDGTKRKRRYNTTYAWFVKKEN